MQTFKIARQNANLPELVRKLRTDSDKVLREFGTKQILAKQLSTKTFNYEFDMVDSRAGGRRKSIQKLKDILLKAVKKELPYLEYCKSGDLLVNGGATNIGINLQMPYQAVTFTRNLSEQTVMSRTKYVRGVERYLRYINHKCIKAGIPIHLDWSRNAMVTVHPEDLPDYERWNSGRGPDIKCRAKYAGTVDVRLTFYEFSTYMRVASGTAPIEGVTINTYADFEKYLVETNNAQMLREYRDAGCWTHRDMGRRGNLATYPGCEKYSSPEKIFLVLDEIVKVIKTFSRITTYDTTAFNIGSAESA
jgi:hypothetical protein